MEQFIKKLALQYGADVCGIGSIDRFLSNEVWKILIFFPYTFAPSCFNSHLFF